MWKIAAKSQHNCQVLMEHDFPFMLQKFMEGHQCDMDLTKYLLRATLSIVELPWLRMYFKTYHGNLVWMIFSLMTEDTAETFVSNKTNK